MRNIRIILINIIILSVLCQNIYALENFGFETKPLTPEQEKESWESREFTFITEEPGKKAIECFDVNEEGLIAVGYCLPIQPRGRVCVYKGEEFLYGYEFNRYGTFAVEWSGDNIVVCMVRSDRAFELNEHGLISVSDIVNDTPQANSHWNYILHSRTRTVDDVEYVKKNDLFITTIFGVTHAKIIKQLPNGENVTVYDASSSYYTSLIVTILIFAIFMAIFIVMFVHFIKNLKNITKQDFGKPWYK